MAGRRGEGWKDYTFMKKTIKDEGELKIWNKELPPNLGFLFWSLSVTSLFACYHPKIVIKNVLKHDLVILSCFPSPS